MTRVGWQVTVQTGGSPLKLSDLIYLLPELILLLGAALVFVLDIVWSQRASAERRSRGCRTWRWPGWRWPLLALIPSLGKTCRSSTMLAVDPFALFFKALAIIGVALVILTAIPYMPAARPTAASSTPCC